MKRIARCLVIIALIAIIGFSMTACPDYSPGPVDGRLFNRWVPSSKPLTVPPKIPSSTVIRFSQTDIERSDDNGNTFTSILNGASVAYNESKIIIDGSINITYIITLTNILVLSGATGAYADYNGDYDLVP